MSFKSIYFGEDSSEAEISYLRNKYNDYFYNKDKVLSRLIKGREFLILGPKGSGKSAIGLMINSLSNKDSITNNYIYSDIFYLEKFPYTYINNLLSDNKGEDNITVQNWEFLLFLSLIDNFSKNSNCKINYKNMDLGVLVKYLTKSKLLSSESLDSLANTIKQREFKLTIPIPFIKGSLDLTEKDNVERKLTHLYDIIKKACFNMDTGGYRHFIILDGLDYVLTSKNINYDLLRSLIQAVMYINNTFYMKNINAKIIILCRIDLFCKIDHIESNKLLQSYSVLLNWYENPDVINLLHPSKLMIMINKRAQTSLHENNINVFNDYFLQHRVYSYRGDNITIFDYTRYTPRDLIMLLNYIKESTHGENPSEDELDEGIINYSQVYFVNEIKNELVGYIKLDTSIKDSILNILGNMYQIISYDDLLSKINKETNFMINDAVMENIFNTLFDCGAIGNTWTEGNRSYRSYKYENNNSTFNKTKNIVVHKALRRAYQPRIKHGHKNY